MSVRFPDLNTWHRVTNWTSFVAAYDYAACRATMGTGEVDAYFFDFLAGCRREGVKPIAYHRLRPAQDVAEQARHFLRIVGTVGVAYALDVESTAGAAREPTIDEADRFLRAITDLTGRPRRHLLVYMPRWWYDAHGGASTKLRDGVLWASRYKLPIDWSPYAGFGDVTIMQYGDDQAISGVGMGDMNESRLASDDFEVALGFKLDDDDRTFVREVLHG